ncbi:hypothetical protein KAR91_67410 [Candidatus Pacearchaeota archaeon]|nr:hypothetical protein [Candidatus Pacearchaeota archaeon]
MNDKINRPESCNECKFYFDCKKGSIANAYGGLECAEKWKGILPTDKIREEFEKWWKEWHEFDIELTTIVKADARYVFKAGYKFRDKETQKLEAENKELRDENISLRGHNTELSNLLIFLEAENKKIMNKE